MFDKNTILTNATKYFETGIKYKFITEDLITFLGESFISAPASTQVDYHYCYEGGLVNYHLQVCKYAISINDSLPENERVDKASLIKVCLLFNIGKAKLYIKNTSDWHLKKGILYDFNKEIPSMRAGERSIYYATQHGIKFTDSEYIAILNADKIQDPMSDYHNSMLGELLKMGSVLAIKHEKLNKK